MRGAFESMVWGDGGGVATSEFAVPPACQNLRAMRLETPILISPIRLPSILPSRFSNIDFIDFSPTPGDPPPLHASLGVVDVPRRLSRGARDASGLSPTTFLSLPTFKFRSLGPLGAVLAPIFGRLPSHLLVGSDFEPFSCPSWTPSEAKKCSKPLCVYNVFCFSLFSCHPAMCAPLGAFLEAPLGTLLG